MEPGARKQPEGQGLHQQGPHPMVPEEGEQGRPSHVQPWVQMVTRVHGDEASARRSPKSNPPVGVRPSEVNQSQAQSHDHRAAVRSSWEFSLQVTVQMSGARSQAGPWRLRPELKYTSQWAQGMDGGPWWGHLGLLEHSGSWQHALFRWGHLPHMEKLEHLSHEERLRSLPTSNILWFCEKLLQRIVFHWRGLYSAARREGWSAIRASQGPVPLFQGYSLFKSIRK